MISFVHALYLQKFQATLLYNFMIISYALHISHISG